MVSLVLLSVRLQAQTAGTNPVKENVIASTKVVVTGETARITWNGGVADMVMAKAPSPPKPCKWKDKLSKVEEVLVSQGIITVSIGDPVTKQIKTFVSTTPVPQQQAATIKTSLLNAPVSNRR